MFISLLFYYIYILFIYMFDSFGWLQINLINNDVSIPVTRRIFLIPLQSMITACPSLTSLSFWCYVCKYISIKNLFIIYVHGLSAICCTNL